MVELNTSTRTSSAGLHGDKYIHTSTLDQKTWASGFKKFQGKAAYAGLVIPNVHLQKYTGYP